MCTGGWNIAPVKSLNSGSMCTGGWNIKPSIESMPIKYLNLGGPRFINRVGDKIYLQSDDSYLGYVDRKGNVISDRNGKYIVPPRVIGKISVVPGLMILK